MNRHHIKTATLPFQAVRAGIKTFEFRKDDRDYQVGDLLVLQEWDTFDFQTGRYSGEEEEVIVTYKLSGPAYGIPQDYCIMSIQKLIPEIMGQKTITIPEGRHQPRGLNLPRPAIFTRSMSLKVKFLPESLYELKHGQTNHLNKLFGWSMGYHRHCSLRITWRPHPDSEQVEIFAYPYQRGKNLVQESLIDGEHDGIHNPFSLGLANLESWYPLSIWISHKKWMFQNGTRLVSIPGPGPGIGYKLDDFFGGDPPAPQPIKYLISK